MRQPDQQQQNSDDPTEREDASRSDKPGLPRSHMRHQWSEDIIATD